MVLRWLILSLVLWNYVSPQPITEEHNERKPRQLDFVECCPCPGSPGFSALAKHLEAAGDGFARTAGADDCPCRREADSEGAPSIFLPRALEPLRLFVSPTDQKEDPKPLLHPEVGLASSVLQTLREVTDEEYEDAVARDAARSAAKSAEPAQSILDAVPETARNIVTILLDPKTRKDEIVSEASEVKEARVLHPSKEDSLGPSPNLLEVFGAKKKGLFDNNLHDMDNAASNVKERVADSMNRGLEGLKLKTATLNLGSANHKTLGELNDKLLKNAVDAHRNIHQHLSSAKIPDFRLSPVLDKLKTPLALKNPIADLRMRKLKQNKNRKTSNGDLDVNTAPSNVEEEFLEDTQTKQKPMIRLKSLLSDLDRPLGIKNLLNLKDVELIPPKPNRSQLQIPNLKLIPTLRKNTEELKDNKDILLRNMEPDDCDPDLKEADLSSNIQVISRVKTEILDAVPSPSENHPSLAVLNAASEETNTLNTLEIEEISTPVPCVSDIQNNIENGITPQVSKIPDEADDNMKANDLEPVILDAESSEKEDTIKTTLNSNKNIEDKVNLNGDVQENCLDESRIIQPAPDTSVQQLEFNDDEGVDLKNISESEEFTEPIKEVGENSEAFKIKNNLESLNNDLDAMTNESKNIAQIVSQEDSEDSSKEEDSDPNFKTDAPYQGDLHSLEEKVAKTEKFSPTIKDSILLKLDTLKDTKTKVMSVARSSKLQEPENNDEKETDARSMISKLSSDELSDESISAKTVTDFIDEDSSDDTDDVGNRVKLQDLQKLSDRLLDTSNKNEQKINSDSKFECKVTVAEDVQSKKDETEKESTFDEMNTKVQGVDLDSSASSQNNVLMENVVSPIDYDDVFEIETTESSNKFIEKLEKSCTNTQQESKRERKEDIEVTSPKLPIRIEQSKMAAEASQSIKNIAPKPSSESAEDNDLGASILDDIIVQPSALFEGSDLNIFRKPMLPIPGLLNLNTVLPQLPTLDDLRTSLSNVLGTERDADDDDFSNEFDSNSDCSNRNTVMSSDASTAKSKSILPSLNPLENINLDIFQLNPLTKIPSLNSYRANIAIPKSLKLKPMTLQSAFGNNKNGLLGATLSIGSDNRGAKSGLGSLLHKRPNILGSSIHLPNLGELGATIRKNSENLLGTSLLAPKYDPIGDTLRASETLGQNLKSHTESTMKNIQQTLASTVNEARVKDLGVLGSQLAKPQDLLEIMANKHDDMTDNLKAIHLDLQDRLASIHEKILDQTKLPPLNFPLALNSKSQIRTNARSETKPSLSLMRTSPSTISSRRESLRQVSKPTSQKKIKLSSTQARNTEQQKLKPFKIPKAASSLQTKNVEVPKLTTMSTPTFTGPLQRDRMFKLRQSKPFASDAVKPKKFEIKRPVLRKFKPLGDIKVSFSTTPRPSTARPMKAKFQTTTSKPALRTKTASLIHRPSALQQKLKSIGDSRGFASEVKPSRVSAPSNFNARSNILNKDILTPSGALSTDILEPKTESPTPKNLTQPAAWPKTAESSFLTKVREALRARFPITPKPPPITTGAIINTDDMARSASENNEVVIGNKPLKENVAYRCKMVCVREPVNQPT